MRFEKDKDKRINKERTEGGFKMNVIELYPDRKDRIDNYLSQETGLTRSQIKKIIENGKVEYNGQIVTKCGLKTDGGKIILVKEEPAVMTAIPQNIPIDIIYEDDDMLVVNKPQGMVVHPALGSPDKTLVNALRYHINSLSSINGDYRPGIVHRLDKDTSGLMVVAKNNKAHVNLAQQISLKTAGRHYLALVIGNIKEDTGTITTGIARSKKDRKTMTVDSTGRKAVTHFFVKERFVDYTLVEFVLETGRTHQIRVHAKYIKHPVVGDLTYGHKSKFDINGQLLHAYKLELNQPSTGERMSFTVPLPDYYKAVLDEIRREV